MITIDTDPKANPIYIGGLILRVFRDNDSRIIDITSLFEMVNDTLELSFDLLIFFFTL